MGKLGKRMTKMREGISREEAVPLEKAVKMLRERATVKFNETVEIAINLGIDPRHSDQQVRGRTALPHGTGKTLRVAVFARDDKAEAAQKAGADTVGAEDLAAEIEAGKIEFDRCIATPDMMGIVGKLGRILGPRNLMPNPKLGTVTPNPAEAVKNAKAGEVQFRAEKNGIIHAGIGKASFDEKQLADNIKGFVRAISAAKPEISKGTYIQKISVSTTMGPGIGVTLSSCLAS